MQLQIKDSAVAPVQRSFLQSPLINDTPFGANVNILEAFQQFIYDELITNDRAQKTIDGYWWMMRSFTRSVGYIGTHDLTLANYQKWRSDMRERGTKRSTVITDVSRFKLFVEYLNRSGCCPLRYRDVKPPKKQTPNPVYLVREEVDRMISTCHNVRDKAILETLFSCGLRNTELRELRRTDIQGIDVHVQHGVKNDDNRHVFLSPKARNLIDSYLVSRVDDSVYLFVSMGSKIANSTLRYIVANAGKRAGIDPYKCHPHAFRHGFGTHLMNGGMHIRGIQDLLGHKYVTTTQIYTHPERENLREKHQKIFATT